MPLYWRAVWANKFTTLGFALMALSITLTAFGPSYLIILAAVVSIVSVLLIVFTGGGYITLRAYQDVVKLFGQDGTFDRDIARMVRFQGEKMYCYRVGVRLAIKELALSDDQARLIIR